MLNKLLVLTNGLFLSVQTAMIERVIMMGENFSKYSINVQTGGN